MKRLYVLKCKDVYKIGITSRSVESRVADMTTGNPFPIDVVKDYSVANAFRLEQRLHSMFHDKKVHGEWFNLTQEDIQTIDSICAPLVSAEKEVKSVKVAAPLPAKKTIAVECRDAAVSTGDTVYLINVPGMTLDEVIIDYIKEPEWVNGVLEYVAVSRLKVTKYGKLPVDFMWASPRYMFADKDKALENLAYARRRLEDFRKVAANE